MKEVLKADWLSRMERYFNSPSALGHMSSIHSDVSLLLHMNLYHDNELATEDQSSPYDTSWKLKGIDGENQTKIMDQSEADQTPIHAF